MVCGCTVACGGCFLVDTVDGLVLAVLALGCSCTVCTEALVLFSRLLPCAAQAAM